MIDICERCKRERLIYAKRICQSCYNSLKNKEYGYKTEYNSKYSTEYQRKWRKKHSTYYRDLQRMKKKSQQV